MAHVASTPSGILTLSSLTSKFFSLYMMAQPPPVGFDLAAFPFLHLYGTLLDALLYQLLCSAGKKVLL